MSRKSTATIIAKRRIIQKVDEERKKGCRRRKLTPTCLGNIEGGVKKHTMEKKERFSEVGSSFSPDQKGLTKGGREKSKTLQKIVFLL